MVGWGRRKLESLVVRISLIKHSLVLFQHQTNLSILRYAGVDTGCFRHLYTDFGHNNLGVPKFNPY